MPNLSNDTLFLSFASAVCTVITLSVLWLCQCRKHNPNPKRIPNALPVIWGVVMERIFKKEQDIEITAQCAWNDDSYYPNSSIPNHLRILICRDFSNVPQLGMGQSSIPVIPSPPTCQNKTHTFFLPTDCIHQHFLPITGSCWHINHDLYHMPMKNSV